ncbi:hypothetical protein GCM10027445_51960 [Amycolatopsis endophytica]
MSNGKAVPLRLRVGYCRLAHTEALPDENARTRSGFAPTRQTESAGRRESRWLQVCQAHGLSGGRHLGPDDDADGTACPLTR